MSMDAELETWRSQWQSGAAVPLGLRRIVERQSCWMKIALIADIAVTVAIGATTLALAVRSAKPDFALLAGAT
jgi:hypothetical protein